VLLEKVIQRMKDRGALVADADPRELALVIVGAHRGGGTIAFTSPGVADTPTRCDSR
jgi:hypothetical protein